MKQRYVKDLSKRKTKLPDEVEVLPKDRIVKELLTKVRKQNLGQEMVSLWNSTQSDRMEWAERQKNYIKDFDSFSLQESKKQFGSISELHLPITYIVCKTYHSRLMELFNDFEIPIRARRSDSVEKEELVRKLLHYAVKDWCNNYEGALPVLDQFVWKWLTAGTAILKVRWEEVFRRYKDVVVVPDGTKPHETVDPETGEPKVVEIPSFKEVEKEVFEPKFVGPVIELVGPEDFGIVGTDGSLSTADALIHRFYMSASDLITQADRGLFDPDAVQTLLKAGPDVLYQDNDGSIKLVYKENAGEEPGTEYAYLDRWEILECYISYDIDGTGVDSDLVLWVHKGTGEVLRATYLQRINRAGLPPFAKADFQIRPNTKYGAGIPEIIQPLADELDAIHNQRLDVAVLTSLPFGFYRPTSGMNPEAIQLTPGALIPVDNPTQDVYFPNISKPFALSVQEEQVIVGWIEKLLGVSDLVFGSMASQGATRTATGARLLSSNMNANISMFAKRLMKAWHTTLKNLLFTLQQHLPPGLEFRLTGETGEDYFVKIKDARDIEGMYDFDLELTPFHYDANTRREIAQMILMLTQNPIDYQLGIITPAHRYEALKMFLKSLGISAISQYIQKPVGQEFALTPEEELQRIIRGGDVNVHISADHDRFIELATEFLRKPEEKLIPLGLSTSEMIGVINKVKQQIRKHQEMKQALEEAQQQQRQFLQQLINAQTRNRDNG